ncbi:ATP-binding protein [Streptomyces sp. 8K308]|uniref:ATP-binding protein n=1 Tax=Streptomyces sp. 8K308 TaxID=2530388 RepID=UPI00104AD116|nr:ATP-binding protein [Streptomyces sp. 8K308]TDC21407.1 ATP-binding protein [Streptomyces sp. 8K308]
MADIRDDEGVIHEHRADYPAYPASVTAARRRVRRLVQGWGLGELAPDVELVVSELVANAVLHGCPAGRLFRVRVVVTVAALPIEVVDSCPERLPQERTAGADDQFGRGLLIVARLTDRWGVAEEPFGKGKAVWCEFDRRPQVGASSW